MVIPQYPLYNIFSTVADRTTALGPVWVATYISKLPGWDVEVIDENNYHDPGPVDSNNSPDHAALQELRPADAVGFYGGLSCTVPRLYKLAQFYQQHGVFTIGGGHHLDFRPDEALASGLKIVVHGEGEETAAAVLAAWEAGQPFEGIKGISYLADGTVATNPPRLPIEDFSGLPLPDFGLLRFARMDIFPISRTRGCGMNCEFCSVKGRARSAAPEQLLAQISYIAETYGGRKFFVVDDQFAQKRTETIRFCRLVQEYQKKMGIRVRLTVQIRLDCGRDDELLAAMRDCGVWQVAIGLESPIDEELVAMNKHIRAKDMVGLIHRFRRYGFFIHGMFIFGYPMQPGVTFEMPAKERLRHFRRFLGKARLDTIQVLTPVPIPGSALRERLEAEGRVLPVSEIGWEYYDGNFPLIVPDAPLTPASMLDAVQELMGKFYGFPRVLGVMLHTLRFPFAMLPLFNLHRAWKRWHRAWFNSVIGTAGYLIIRNWKRAFREDNFRDKLDRATS